MAMSAASMAARIEAYVGAVAPVQGSSAEATESYRTEVLVALCQGIVDEIVQNAVVTTTSGAPDGEHTGNVI